MALATMKTTYGAVGNGSTNDAAAFASVPAGSGAFVEAGTYQIASNITISGSLVFAPGAILRVATGITVIWDWPAAIWAGDYQIFDFQGTGVFNGYQLAGWARSSWFPGGTTRDLGVQLNKAFDWGFTSVDVPPAPNHEIRTTVKIRHAVVIRMDWHGFPRHVNCKTSNKPVFEAIGDVRHWRIIGGVFDGDTTGTPSCFLLMGSDETNQDQCGDTTAITETHVTGHWGQAIVVNIAAEVVVFQNAKLWIQGKGDSTRSDSQRSTVMIGNADYWSTPYTYTQPTVRQRSCSAMLFRNCDLRGGLSGNGQVVLLKGRAEDISVTGTYFNSQGTSHFRVEGGKAVNPDNNTNEWSSARNLLIDGGRSETNTGSANNGVPLVIVDAINTEGAGVDTGLYGLTIGKMGHFVGTQSNTTPIVKTVNNAILDAFTFNQGGQIAWTSKLLEHTGKDLNWANIWTRETVTVDCTGRSINKSDIKIGGQVLGTIGTGTSVRASNVNNWATGSSGGGTGTGTGTLGPELLTRTVPGGTGWTTGPYNVSGSTISGGTFSGTPDGYSGVLATDQEATVNTTDVYELSSQARSTSGSNVLYRVGVDNPGGGGYAHIYVNMSTGTFTYNNSGGTYGPVVVGTSTVTTVGTEKLIKMRLQFKTAGIPNFVAGIAETSPTGTVVASAISFKKVN
jgi:hypothetical protein